MAGAGQLWGITNSRDTAEAAGVEHRATSRCRSPVDFEKGSGRKHESVRRECLRALRLGDRFASHAVRCISDRGNVSGTADCENIYDELKNQWGLAGFCSQQSNVTELAARLT